MSTVSVPAAGRSLFLDGVNWRTYERLLRVFAERPAIRLTYDRGRLEIMSPLHEHESDARFLGRLAVTLTEELGLTIKAGGSTTCRLRRRQRGLEPDDCYWIANEPRVRGKRRIDLRTDPPPDLAIEADVTSSSLNRMSIYAALGVPEVWRIDGSGVTFHALAQGAYAVAANSLAFPLLTPADVFHFMQLRYQAQGDENAVVRELRTWVRQRLSGGAAQAP